MFTLGIAISTIRSELWEDLALNLATNNVDYEIIFVGPLKNVSLPKNCRFIYSDACVAKCFNIGIMACDSEYIFACSDDARFTPESALDCLVEDIKNSPPISIVSPFYTKKEGKPAPPQTFMPFNKKKTWDPLMPVGLLMSKQLYVDLGGIDRRFKNVFWDLDLAMRVYKKGGEVYINRSVTIFEAVPGNLTTVSRKDEQLIRGLWCKGRRISGWTIREKRRDKVQSFGGNDD